MSFYIVFIVVLLTQWFICNKKYISNYLYLKTYILLISIFPIRCMFDTCGCDLGGDCECMCTAVATYAFECNIHGFYVRWRKPDFCREYIDHSSMFFTYLMNIGAVSLIIILCYFNYINVFILISAIQCDKTCENYEPCVSTCPDSTCETLKQPQSTTCIHETCVEGTVLSSKIYGI